MEGMIANIMESMPGFKFHPGDEELLLLYLKPKIEGTLVEHPCIIPEVDVCLFDPWNFPKHFDNLSAMKSQEGAREWFFFSPVKCKYMNSQRVNRSTPSGYWKVTGINRDVKTEDGTSIGFKKTLVFHKGRFPTGKRTGWVMHECHLHASCLSDDSYVDQLPYVACRIKWKNKKGVTSEDYPTEHTSSSSPYTSDVADHTRINKGDTSSYNTPNATPEYHQAPVYPHGTAYQEGEISLHDVYFSLPNIQQLDIDGADEHNLQGSCNAFDYSYMPPPSLPWSTYDHGDNSGHEQGSPYGGSSNTYDYVEKTGYGWGYPYGGSSSN
ncbi:hypothetical protein MLD38_032149 [Melastoma candidum]|uniref:Uncharacterized protein n=1 Tax=Melastoma candidum TaxID=119954 RepID=A0ACB9M2T1_9MYRT|nr:hypothetical protein MLD38_032149 [Melastoma candidum]